MSTILTSAIVENAKGTVDSYISTATGLYDELTNIINSLCSTNFIGDASDGYKDFYTSKVVPAITDNLTAASGSITASIKEILDAIKTQLLDTLDPQLGSENRNPGGAN